MKRGNHQPAGDYCSRPRRTGSYAAQVVLAPKPAPGYMRSRTFTRAAWAGSPPTTSSATTACTPTSITRSSPGIEPALRLAGVSRRAVKREEVLVHLDAVGCVRSRPRLLHRCPFECESRFRAPAAGRI